MKFAWKNDRNLILQEWIFIESTDVRVNLVVIICGTLLLELSKLITKYLVSRVHKRIHISFYLYYSQNDIVIAHFNWKCKSVHLSEKVNLELR